MLEEDEEFIQCVDDDSATFSLLSMDKEVDCSWLSQNKFKEQTRKEKYCGLNRTKLICSKTCDFCSCQDDEKFTFELMNVKNPVKKTQHCSWLTSNSKKKDKLIGKYCTEDFDDGAVLNVCPMSCGVCDAGSD